MWAGIPRREYIRQLALSIYVPIITISIARILPFGLAKLAFIVYAYEGHIS